MKTLFTLLTLFFLSLNTFAEEIDDIKLCNAIFKAEGSYKATYLYGIRSIKYKDEAEARQICLNSIRNNKKRWLKAGKPDDFISFMAKRYAPIKGNLTETEKKLNQFWIKNVLYFYRKEK